MVKFGLPVFLRFGLMVKNSAFWFSYDSAFRIRPNVPVFLCIFTPNFKWCGIWWKIIFFHHLFEANPWAWSYQQNISRIRTQNSRQVHWTETGQPNKLKLDVLCSIYYFGHPGFIYLVIRFWSSMGLAANWVESPPAKCVLTGVDVTKTS